MFNPKTKYKDWKLEEVNFKTIFYGYILCNHIHVLHRSCYLVVISHAVSPYCFTDEMKIICFPFLMNCCDKTVHPKRQELSKGAIKILLTPNAGGDSQISEALSFEIFYRLCNAVLLKVVLIVYFFFYFMSCKWNCWRI